MSAFRPQKLDVRYNSLPRLPNELSSLANLNELVLSYKHIKVVPVSVLSGLTALTIINLSHQSGPCQSYEMLLIKSSLLAILHPGLVRLDLRQKDMPWDLTSLLHLGSASTEVFKGDPIPTLLF